MILFLIAYCTSSAPVFNCKSSIALYLWPETVRVEILRIEAASCTEFPSANSFTTSRCRGDNRATHSRALGGPQLNLFLTLGSTRRQINPALQHSLYGVS